MQSHVWIKEEDCGRLAASVKVVNLWYQPIFSVFSVEAAELSNLSAKYQVYMGNEVKS